MESVGQHRWSICCWLWITKQWVDLESTKALKIVVIVRVVTGRNKASDWKGADTLSRNSSVAQWGSTQPFSHAQSKRLLKLFLCLQQWVRCQTVMNRNISITLLLFLISIMDLSVCFPPNYYSYPFCTAQYGLTIFRTITRTVLSSTLTVFSNAHLLT